MSMEYSQVIYWNYLLRYGRLLFLGDEAISSGYISTGRYYDDVDITNGTLLLDWLHTSHVHKTIFSSDVAITSVCKYSGTRFAPIYVPNYASSVCITIFFL